MEVDPQILDDLMKNPGYEGQQANTTSEFYAESFSEVLAKSIGYFVTAEFLIGSNNLVERSGILYAVGNNFMTLQEGPDGPFMICDVYSVKFEYDIKKPCRHHRLQGLFYLGSACCSVALTSLNDPMNMFAGQRIMNAAI